MAYMFVEGSRSRTGKAMVPKSGMLSVIVSAVIEGTVTLLTIAQSILDYLIVCFLFFVFFFAIVVKVVLKLFSYPV